MSIWGKLLAGTFGFALGGPIGALLGVIAGHSVDKIRSQSSAYQENLQSPQEISQLELSFYLQNLLKLMGKLQLTKSKLLEISLKYLQTFKVMWGKYLMRPKKVLRTIINKLNN